MVSLSHRVVTYEHRRSNGNFVGSSSLQKVQARRAVAPINLSPILAKPFEIALYYDSDLETRGSQAKGVHGSAMKTETRNAAHGRSTLVYDGDCSFCRRWVARIAHRDSHGTFEFVARQTEGLTERFPKLAEGDFNTGMRLITPDDTIHVGADAAYQIARRLTYWRKIAWLYHVPGIHGCTQSVYAWIAANRQSLGR